MILLYSIFASSVIFGGLVIAVSILRGGYTDSVDKSAFQFIQEEHL
ncbi:MAG: hypothetical protein ACI9OH_001926 [Oleispira sp.]|jgi:hypothetical protein